MRPAYHSLQLVVRRVGPVARAGRRLRGGASTARWEVEVRDKVSERVILRVPAGLTVWAAGDTRQALANRSRETDVETFLAELGRG